jgi:hypothetical protein
MSAEDYHPFVPAPGQSNVAGPTPRAHTEARMRSPRAQELFETWAKLATAPFQGMTTDGHVQHGLFSLAPQDAPTPAMVEAVHALLNLLTHEQRAATCLPIDSELWRQLAEHRALCRASRPSSRRDERDNPGSGDGRLTSELERQGL